MRTRVLIVDDSPIIRRALEQALAADPDIEVVGTAPDPYVARDKILELKPDVLTLDIEMPRMDGISFLKKIMEHHPIPVIIVSSLTVHGSAAALQALAAGAFDVMAKPGAQHRVDELAADLRDKVKLAAKVDVRKLLAGSSSAAKTPEARRPVGSPSAISDAVVIAIGASTGGTRALEELLVKFPADAPPTVITQHMPPGFTKSFADRLNGMCAVKVREAVAGDSLARGTVLIAPGNQHLAVVSSPAGLRVDVQDGPLVSGHRPSVDVLFASVAATVGKHALGIIMTGMGGDGAKGLLKIREAGGRTFAQDEESCVVFGMPKVAIELGAVEQIVSLGQLQTRVFSTLAASPA